jgi:hypothetical protein
VRKVWIEEKDAVRPVVTVTGSHRHISVYIFGTVSLEGRQIFRQFDRFKDDSFYNFLKQVHIINFENVVYFWTRPHNITNHTR